MRRAEKPIQEARDQHRDAKAYLLRLIDRLEMYNLSRDKIKAELFELYLKLK